MDRLFHSKLNFIWNCCAIAMAVCLTAAPHQSFAQPPPPVPRVIPAQQVRGYLAVAVGRSSAAEADGLFSTAIPGKEIYLPGVSVYLENAQSGGENSASVVTDLSGRFTIYAPEAGRYHLCWKSPEYGDGCLTTFVSVGSTPQFVSTVNIKIPRKEGRVAIVGNVTAADGSSLRTFEPMMNINAFGRVSLNDAKGNRLAFVYVNDFGDYLLPYVPIKQKISVVAGIESAKVSQEIRPEARLEVATLHRVNLKIENHRPRLNPLFGVDAVHGRRVQNAQPGATVHVNAKATDKDGDPVKYAWFVDSAAGQLSQFTGSAVKWTLPATAGRYSVSVVAYDNKGGYDKAVYELLADGAGVPFGGVVVDQNGAALPNALVEIVGNPSVVTDSHGRFQIRAKEADRYVFNIRKEGYAINSQVYDNAVTGGRWILRAGEIATIDPTQNVSITHNRTARDCPGPQSLQAGFGPAGNTLMFPQWQDGRGNIVDPPPRPAVGGGNHERDEDEDEDRDRDSKDRDEHRGREHESKHEHEGKHEREGKHEHDRDDDHHYHEPLPAILPLGLNLPKCGPGVTVDIPANSIVDANGNLATSPIKVTIATVDLLSPDQMPGDGSVVPRTGGGAYLESYGAGSLDLPTGYKLKPGALAAITIPVDRSRLLGGPLPPTVPLLSYDEQKGLWVEEDQLTLSTTNGVQTYKAKVKHFTSYNADTFFTNAACLRVFSPSLPGSYDLEVMSPYPDGTPHYKKYPIDNVSSTEHVIYNITPNANMTLAPMTQGANPQLLGFYVVNSGPPQTPSNSPNVPPGPPYTSCNNFIVLKTGNAPDSPIGGEFLGGLGFIDSANLGFNPLDAAGPTGNALIDAIIAASKAYYASVDPTSIRTTFAAFKTKNGFNQNPSIAVAGEVVAQYANSGDLGFGRDMHCLKKVGKVACYVTNYGTGYSNVAPGGGTNDQDDANAAGTRSTVNASTEVATVAMEYSPIEGDPAGDSVVKFFVYKKGFTSYGRAISANLDGRGERPVPQLCMICHGGQIPSQAGGIPAFSTPAQVKLGSRFLPFDHRFFTFPTNPANLSKANQEAKIKTLNEQIVSAAPPAPTTDPISEVISGLYNNGASATQIHNFTVPGWAAGASANAPNQNIFYQGVVANVCRTCHIAQPYAQLHFNTSDKFLNVNTAVSTGNHLMLGTAQDRVCGDYVMPHALRTHDIFWNNFWDTVNWGPPPTPFYTQFQTFGDGVGGTTWKPGLCTSFISNNVSSPSNFYEQVLQPIWNGKCVACHVAGGAAGFLPLTEGVSFGQLLTTPGIVVPGNDADTSGSLLRRITGHGLLPGEDRMPQGCIAPPTPPGPGQLPCLDQTDIDTIKAWIRSGAN
jgi:Carboxypeptidase regulatory-like domain